MHTGTRRGVALPLPYASEWFVSIKGHGYTGARTRTGVAWPLHFTSLDNNTGYQKHKQNLIPQAKYLSYPELKHCVL